MAVIINEYLYFLGDYYEKSKDHYHCEEFQKVKGGIEDLGKICDGKSECHGITIYSENGQNRIKKCLSRKLKKSFDENQTTYMKMEDGML